MLLAIDTATTRASVALHDGHTLRDEFTWEAVRKHTVTLAPHIRQILAASDVTAQALTALAVCIGPGSYTGVRIGVAVAQGLAVTRRLPLIGVSTLDILVAAQPPDPRPLYALFAAGRKRAGFARYRWRSSQWEIETEVEVVTWAELAEQFSEPSIVVGEIEPQGWDALRPLGDLVEIPPPARHLRRAGFLADLAWARLRAGERGRPADIRPLYAR